MRSSNPCDGCALRRVRCQGGYPCDECRNRLVSCTYLRARRKRGPKGPRSETNQKIEKFQRQLQGDNRQNPHDGLANQTTPETNIDTPSPTRFHRFSLDVYQQVLEIYHLRLYTVWPVVSHKDLMARLRNDDSDFEAYSLASALCAAVIAQLRLREHAFSFGSIPSTDFEAEAQKLRYLFDYHEHYSLTSLLTSFFLHIYFANVDKLRTAGFFLREALTYAHGLGLHKPDTHADVEPVTRQLMLRIYWILFVSERLGVAIQNNSYLLTLTQNILCAKWATRNTEGHQCVPQRRDDGRIRQYSPSRLPLAHAPIHLSQRAVPRINCTFDKLPTPK